MKLLLNIGMHKTGTSAIQQSLKRFNNKTVRYLPGIGANHSALYSTLFLENPSTYGAHKKNSRTPEDVKSLRDNFESKFLGAIKKCRQQGASVLLSSGEDVCNLDLASVERMRGWLFENFDEVELVGYVRPPASYLTSALQQRVRGGMPINIEQMYPNYRTRFEKFDIVFGRERTTLVKYDRANLYRSDVVLDFCKRASVEFDPDEVVKENQSRGLETISTLYAQRRLGRGWINYAGSPRDNVKLVNALAALGTTPITFSAEKLQSIVDQNSEDLDWISERVGQPIRDASISKSENSEIENSDHLLALSGTNLPGLLDIIKNEVGTKTVDPQIIANAVDLLIDVIRVNNDD